MKQIRLSGIVSESIVDGPGLRYVIFTQGCVHRCKGCHNPQTHDINGGYLENSETILKEIKSNPLLSGITFSGGEPFLQPEICAHLAREIKKLGHNIYTYSGFTFEELLEMGKSNPSVFAFLALTDVLIDGKFEEEKHHYLLKFKGSENQRVIDVQKSLKAQEVVLHVF